MDRQRNLEKGEFGGGWGNLKINFSFVNTVLAGRSGLARIKNCLSEGFWTNRLVGNLTNKIRKNSWGGR